MHLLFLAFFTSNALAVRTDNYVGGNEIKAIKHSTNFPQEVVSLIASFSADNISTDNLAVHYGVTISPVYSVHDIKIQQS